MTTLWNIAPNTNAEVYANLNFSATAPAGLFGVKSSVGLTLGYFGGLMRVNGVLTTVADGALTLANAATNYVEVAPDGSITSNTTGFTAGRTPLYTIVTAGSVMTTITDQRVLLQTGYSRLNKSIAGAAATVTLTEAEARNKVMEFSGAITGAQNIVLPNSTDSITVYNGTSGAFSVTFKTGGGAGIVVATGKRAIVYANGTDVVRVSPDV